MHYRKVLSTNGDNSRDFPESCMVETNHKSYEFVYFLRASSYLISHISSYPAERQESDWEWSSEQSGGLSVRAACGKTVTQGYFVGILSLIRIENSSGDCLSLGLE